MAAGPFLGAAILGAVHPAAALSRLGVEPGTFAARPGARLALGVLRQRPDRASSPSSSRWAASSGWETPRRAGRLDIVGAVLFSALLVGALGALTLLGSRPSPTPAASIPTVVAAVLASPRSLARSRPSSAACGSRDPFIDPRLFRIAGVRLGDGGLGADRLRLATAIVGGAVFVDRVLYGGPDEQRLALGALAGATAVGALASGFIVRVGLAAAGDARRPGRVDRRAGRHVGLDDRDARRRGRRSLAVFGRASG